MLINVARPRGIFLDVRYHESVAFACEANAPGTSMITEHEIGRNVGSSGPELIQKLTYANPEGQMFLWFYFESKGIKSATLIVVILLICFGMLCPCGNPPLEIFLIASDTFVNKILNKLTLYKAPAWSSIGLTHNSEVGEVAGWTIAGGIHNVVFGVRLCVMYTNQELAEMHFMYGKADGNAALARRLYQERYPQRQCPDRKTFGLLKGGRMRSEPAEDAAAATAMTSSNGNAELGGCWEQHEEITYVFSCVTIVGLPTVHRTRVSDDTAVSSTRSSRRLQNGTSSISSQYLSVPSTGSRRRKPVLSAKERNLRRLESNERERMRMHSLNDAFQVFVSFYSKSK
ncbi:hypothetical protein C0J52_20837 [Blattella germanica]|nr:hypothetical protein C0J52_20837 [Blattella germanica]